MKIAILSDLHGSLSALERVLDQLAPWQPDHYLLLGDLLNHGPRNPVPPPGYPRRDVYFYAGHAGRDYHA